MLTTVYLIHLGSTWFMVGLIWLIQIVHYPLFSKVGAEHFVSYERDHSRLITYIVAPLMLIELSTGIGMTYLLVQTQAPGMIANGLLLALIWISTFVVQVPLHQQLESGFQPHLHQRLVTTNWIRTFAWSFRGILLLSIAPEII